MQQVAIILEYCTIIIKSYNDFNWVFGLFLGFSIFQEMKI